MKKSFLRYAATIIILATNFAISAATQNDANSVGGTINNGVNNDLSNISSNINSGISNTGKNLNQGLVNNKALLNGGMQNATNSLIAWLNANLVTGIPPGFVKSMKGNWQIILANFSLDKLNWLLTQKFTAALLAGANPNSIDEIQGEDISVPIASTNPNELKAQVGHFNIGSLLSKTAIEPNSTDAKNAQVLLQFVSGLNNAVSALPSKAATSGMGPVDKFQSQFGTYLAQQSVGINALYNLLNERLVKKGLRANGSETDMSPLSLDQYMATRRLDTADSDNDWLSQLATATPAQMSKEQLMLLAEMRYEMYLTRQSLEQITTLLAVQQLQLNNENAAKLEQLKNQVMAASTSTILK